MRNGRFDLKAVSDCKTASNESHLATLAAKTMSRKNPRRATIEIYMNRPLATSYFLFSQLPLNTGGTLVTVTF
jgi:hypothetical protein